MKFTKNDLNKTLWVKRECQEKNRMRYKVDATGLTLGRLAVDIANKLAGKDKSYLSDFWDAGSYVIVENAGKFIVKGNNKLKQKKYYSYSGYKGNVKSISLDDLIQKDPTKALWHAVRGMLPKNKLRDSRMKRLKLVVDTTTKYDNFKPVNLYK
ncbi:MAG TPA: 50S ribosomal protein L13 [Candidatus Absconditabacterales bacterium]|nr:50S ribosomal protein L13 [Candidatus Absconditabacterales bacterium]HRU49882.1 50S ribosomal protein L13 [Candidatus Absconditabacterales bacterium]